MLGNVVWSSIWETGEFLKISMVKMAAMLKNKNGRHLNNNNNNNIGRNGSCLTWLATSLEERRRWPIINASPRGQCSK